MKLKAFTFLIVISLFDVLFTTKTSSEANYFNYVSLPKQTPLTHNNTQVPVKTSIIWEQHKPSHTTNTTAQPLDFLNNNGITYSSNHIVSASSSSSSTKRSLNSQNTTKKFKTQNPIQAINNCEVEIGDFDGSFEYLESATKLDTPNGKIEGGGWIKGSGTPDSWKAPVSVHGDGTNGPLNYGFADGTPESPDKGVFAAVYGYAPLIAGSIRLESFYTNISGLVINQQYKVVFYQVNAGVDPGGILALGTLTNSKARLKVTFGNEEQFSEEQPYLGEGNQVWEEQVLTFTAKSTTQRLEFTADKGTDINTIDYIGIDGIKVLSIISTPPPTGNATQKFCKIDNPTVADLQADGTDIKWYRSSTGGSFLSSSTALTNRNYYASQTTNNCESSKRLKVAVTINDSSTPTGNATQKFCKTDNPTVADLQADGTGIKWYASVTATTPLAATTLLEDGKSYYAGQTTDGCSSTQRLKVDVTIDITIQAPTGEPTQEFCSADRQPTVADLQADGTDIKWYASVTDTIPVAATALLEDGKSFYAGQTIAGCSSTQWL
ncbi:MAG: hypothetical protein ACK5H1_07940 [Tenacibaculum sp.]